MRSGNDFLKKNLFAHEKLTEATWRHLGTIYVAAYPLCRRDMNRFKVTEKANNGKQIAPDFFPLDEAGLSPVKIC